MSAHVRVAVLLAAALALAGCSPAAPPASDATLTEPAPEEPTEPAPTEPAEPTQAAEPTQPADGPLVFTAVDLAGAEVDLAELSGEPVVLWFWAPWCSICRGEGPQVADVAAALDGVTFIGVAGHGEVPAMEVFVADTGTGAFTHLVDDDGSLWQRFGVTYQPAYAFISSDGFVEVHVGALGAAALTERAEALT